MRRLPARLVALVAVAVALACERPAEHERPEASDARHDAHDDHGAHGDHDAHDAHHDRDVGGHDDPHDGEAPAAVRLSPDALATAGVRLETAGPGRLDGGLELLGEVRPNGDRLAHIGARFPGIVREVRHGVGDRVRAGDVLAVVESNESLAPYELRTLIDGTIIDKHMTRGEAVDRESGGFVVADLSTVWVDFAVYQKDLAQLRVGTPLLLASVAGGVRVDAAIAYLAPVVDPDTRTATARAVVANPEGAWRPGAFVSARVLDPEPAPVVVPRTALLQLEGRPTVFVETDDGLVPRPVRPGRTGTALVEIAEGLAAGTRYVAEGGFLLKAELGKAAAEHQH